MVEVGRRRPFASLLKKERTGADGSGREDARGGGVHVTGMVLMRCCMLLMWCRCDVDMGEQVAARARRGGVHMLLAWC